MKKKYVGVIVDCKNIQSLCRHVLNKDNIGLYRCGHCRHGNITPKVKKRCRVCGAKVIQVIYITMDGILQSEE